MGIRVLSPGLATTVQDLGRPGYYHLGIPISGAMDLFAFRAANLLVGNDESAAALETVFMGPELEFTSDATVAVTGAELPPKLDGEPCDLWSSFDVKSGQVLSFGYLRSGARSYIAVSGGIDVPVVLGSRSTYLLGTLGGHQGRTILKGDNLPTATNSRMGTSNRRVHESFRRKSSNPSELRIMPGLYWHWVTEQSQTNFLDDIWKVAPEADRIGYRFRGGRAIDFVERPRPFGAGSNPSNIVDSCYPYGSVQIPGGTEPIVLHRDAVSGGGYFMVGTIISADMDLIAQMQPHTLTNFIEVDMDTALSARKEQQKILYDMRASIT